MITWPFRLRRQADPVLELVEANRKLSQALAAELAKVTTDVTTVYDRRKQQAAVPPFADRRAAAK